MSNREVLAIGGHPDDIEQFCGGTLIHLKNLGFNITIAALTDGACGSKTISAEEIIAIREKEALRGAELIGAKYRNLGIRDGSIEYNLENARKVVALIRQVQPLIIFTHPAKDDYMTDHWHTGALVLWAVPEAGHPNFEAPGDFPVTTTKPYIYHTDPQGLIGPDGQYAKVNTIVDVTGTKEKALEAFAAHASQMGFLAHRQKGNALEKTRRWAVVRGEQVRVEYGEGFCQQLSADYSRDNILLKLLPDKVFTL